MNSRLLAPIMAACLPALLTACHPRGADAPVPMAVRSDTIVPGDPRLDPRRLAVGTRDFDWVADAPSGRRTLGTWHDALTSESREGRPVLARVLRADLGRSALIDSSWSDPRTLAPIRHRSAQPGRSLEVRWTSTAIEGWVQPVSGARQVRDTTLSRPTFDSSNWDLIVRSLDLGPGVVRVFPVYDVDNRLSWYKAAVIGDTLIAGARAWVVEATLGTAWAELTIDDRTRAVHRQRMGNPKAPMQVLPAAPRTP